jgi:ketosteroid isomerase-like protein
METKEIAKKLVEYCKHADWNGAHDTLYAPDATSIEPTSTPEFEKETNGLDAIRQKGRKFDSMVEQVHSIEVSEPLIAGNTIAFVLAMDVTMKNQGRMKAPELCVYQVREGKIISEQFFV